MARLIVTPGDDNIARFGNMIAALGEKARPALRRAVNRVGDKAKTQVIRALTKQTGLKRAVIVRAVKVKRAFDGGGGTAGSLDYVMTTTGGNISLKYFGAREVRRGVSAAPRGERMVAPGAFIRGGRWPKRVALALGGHVFENIAPGRPWSGQVRKVKSGVFIPEEMVRGATAAAFEAVVRRDLPDRVGHELRRLLP